MENIFLGIGSNMGKRVQFLSKAVLRLMNLPSTLLVKISSVYETEPVGVKNQGDFLNAVVWLATSRDVNTFYADIKAIEREIGKQKRVRWGPREIDIDILLYGRTVVAEGPLIIPHREMEKRNFVLIPLGEIAPAVVHPVREVPIRTLMHESLDTARVTYSAHMTEELRALIGYLTKSDIPAVETIKE